MKDVSTVRHGSSTFDLRLQNIVERKTIAAGLIGIGNYPKEVRDRLVTVAPNTPWAAAYVFAPAVGDAPAIGIDQIDMEVKLNVHGSERDTQSLKWTPSTGWTDSSGVSRTSLVFPLLGVTSAMDDVSTDIITQITHGQEALEIHRTIHASSPVITPTALVDAIRINSDDLTFKRMAAGSKLIDVQIALSAGEQTGRTTLRAQHEGGVWVSPNPFIWLIEKQENGEKSITPTIVFDLDDGTQKSWRFNNQDLRKAEPSLDFSLLDSDWH
jgi:hypothetical protein